MKKLILKLLRLNKTSMTPIVFAIMGLLLLQMFTFPLVVGNPDGKGGTDGKTEQEAKHTETGGKSPLEICILLV